MPGAQRQANTDCRAQQQGPCPEVKRYAPAAINPHALTLVKTRIPVTVSAQCLRDPRENMASTEPWTLGALPTASDRSQSPDPD
jgi:hypothetical protein